MGVLGDPHRPVGLAQQERVLGDRRAVVRIRIGRPGQVPDAPAVRRVVPAVLGFRLEVLRDVVRDQYRDPARPAMRVRGLHRLAQVVLADHVLDRVVHEDRVERPAQPDGPHVALHVLALRVQLGRDGQHVGGQVDQGELEVRLEVECVIAAAAAELQHGTAPGGAASPRTRPPRRTPPARRSAATTAPGRRRTRCSLAAHRSAAAESCQAWLCRSASPRTYPAWPRCCSTSPSTLTSRTAAVTGGSQLVSTTRAAPRR